MDIIKLKETILQDNDADAHVLREELKHKKICLMNLMSSPGSGKTTTLTALINMLKQEYKIGEMDVDIESSLDAQMVINRKVCRYRIRSMFLITQKNRIRRMMLPGRHRQLRKMTKGKKYIWNTQE